MVYVVERYLPGLSRADLLPRLARLEPVIEELHGEGSVVRYLGSTIVLEDEACFCQFEGSSVAAVAEANRRADLLFDRIVPAVLVQPTQRSSEMSVSTFIPKPARLRQSHWPAAIAAIMIVSALAVVVIVGQLVGSTTRPAHSDVAAEASALRSLTPQERQYVLGIQSLTPAQVRAAFGTSPTSVPGARSGIRTETARPSAPTLDSVLRSLTPREREYVLGILSLTPAQLQAAFGTSRTPVLGGRSTPASTATGPSVASPILPACGPGSCWHAATGSGRAAPHDR
jgi:hypothetical protein